MFQGDSCTCLSQIQYMLKYMESAGFFCNSLLLKVVTYLSFMGGVSSFSVAFFFLPSLLTQKVQKEPSASEKLLLLKDLEASKYHSSLSPCCLSFLQLSLHFLLSLSLSCSSGSRLSSFFLSPFLSSHSTVCPFSIQHSPFISVQRSMQHFIRFCLTSHSAFNLFQCRSNPFHSVKHSITFYSKIPFNAQCNSCRFQFIQYDVQFSIPFNSVQQSNPFHSNPFSIQFYSTVHAIHHCIPSIFHLLFNSAFHSAFHSI